MRRTLLTLVIALGAATLFSIGGCAGAGTPPAPKGPASGTATQTPSLETSVTLPRQGVTEDFKPIPGGATLSLRLGTATASVNETVTAKITYSNPSTSTLVITAAGGSYYNVRVKSAGGRIAFDSWSIPSWAHVPVAIEQLAPSKTMSGTVSFSLKDPGTYGVVAYLGNTETLPVSLTVSQ